MTFGQIDFAAILNTSIYMEEDTDSTSDAG